MTCPIVDDSDLDPVPYQLENTAIANSLFDHLHELPSHDRIAALATCASRGKTEPVVLATTKLAEPLSDPSVAEIVTAPGPTPVVGPWLPVAWLTVATVGSEEAQVAVVVILF